MIRVFVHDYIFGRVCAPRVRVLVFADTRVCGRTRVITRCRGCTPAIERFRDCTDVLHVCWRVSLKQGIAVGVCMRSLRYVIHEFEV